MVQFGEWHSRRWVSAYRPYFEHPLNIFAGDLLVSTGDDASIRTWKKAVNGRWAEYAEIETAREN